MSAVAKKAKKANKADITATVPRLALRAEEAAEAIGVSDDFFREHVAPELRVVRRGRLKLYPISELQKWLEKNAAVALAGDR